MKSVLTGFLVTDRQKAVLNRYLDGFEGKLTAKKWAELTKVSIPSAQRDINDLVERAILRRNPGGSKNTSYDIIIIDQQPKL
jgi:Fic family protein